MHILSRHILMFSLLSISQVANASWPEPVLLSSMTEHDGTRIADVAALTQSYQDLVAQLGSVIANKPLAPAHTTGLYGIDISIFHTVGFTGLPTADGLPSPWERVHEEESPSPALFIPGITIRKGLPFSTEIGASMAWIGQSNSGVVAGFARIGVVEGYRPWPDINLHMGYSGYIGNDELELGVLDLGASIGTTISYGSFDHPGRFSPFADISWLQVSAMPRLDDDTASSIGATTLKADSASDTNPPISMAQIGAGFELTRNIFSFRLSVAWAIGGIPTVNTGFGLTL